ncbi:MAG TPA: ABC transporter ATP-binding protein [Desulfobacterales bacterium]|nr:ABC transporter ATP-binding protein [Desulfobacterales bacterium]
MGPPVINVRNLWFSFDGQPVLKDVTFEVNEGEFLALIGPNGGGKTTLLKLLLGLLTADRGQIGVFGQSPRKAAHRIGYVPQDIHINQNFPISVMDVVLMGRLISSKARRRHSKDDKLSAEKAMEELGVWEHRDRQIGDLSGGERQRVFIARALVTDPEMLMLDEPTASVDTKGQGEIFELLKQVNEKVTVVLVSHDLMMISSYIKSVACVNQFVHYHPEAEITVEMVEMCHCNVDLIAHGLPHRVLRKH